MSSSIRFPTRLIIPLSIFILFGCWEKQNNELLRPETPHYLLTGQTLDMDGRGMVLSDIEITLFAEQLLYDVPFEPVFMVSDEEGFFRVGQVYPGDYTITAKRDGYTVLSRKLTVKHADKSLQLFLAPPLLTYRSYRLAAANIGVVNPRISAKSALWITGYKSGYGIDSYNAVFRAYTRAGGLEWSAAFKNPLELLNGIEHHNGRLYLYRSDRVLILDTSEEVGDYQYSLPLVADFNLPGAIHGMTADNRGFWTTFERDLQYRGGDLKTVNETYTTGVEALGEISVYRDGFLVHDRAEEVVRILDGNGGITRSFKPIDVQTGEMITIHDFDYSGTLWITDQDKGFLHQFMLPEGDSEPDNEEL